MAKSACPTCGKAACPRCDPGVPAERISRHLPCFECTFKGVEEAFEQVAIAGLYDGPDEMRARRATMMRAAQVIPRAELEKWKENTRGNYSRLAKIGELWGEVRGIEVLGSAMFMSPYVVAAYYLDRVDEGEGVQPATANAELTVWSHWWNHLCRLFPERAKEEHPVHNGMIRDLKARAKLWFQKAAEAKEGYTVKNLEAYWFLHDASGNITGDWLYDHTRLCVGIMFFYLARSIAAAHVVFRGDYRGPVASSESDIVWGTDKLHGAFQHVAFEKDKTLRNKQTSDRYHPFENGTRVNIAKYTRDYIRHYKMPSGTYLLAVRRADGSFQDTPFTNWSRVTDRVCKALSLERELFGTQSCRRGCAEWLNRCNIDFEHVGLLGNWLTNVVRRYTGAQSAPHLEVWRAAKGNAAKAGETLPTSGRNVHIGGSAARRR